MKFSAAFLAGLCRAEPVQFLDFWTETDIFAFQIQNAISDVVKGNAFLRKYENVREVLQHYENGGNCASNLSDPTYAHVSVATFDEKLNEAANIDNLVDMLDDWIQSYACIDKKGKLKRYNRAMDSMRQIGNNDEFQEEIFNFEVSNEKMSYTDALGYCFLKDMRLVAFNGEDSVAVRQMMSLSLEDGEWYWYDDDGCNAVEGTEALIYKNFDCETELNAICMTGQYGTTTKAPTTTTTTKCESIFIGETPQRDTDVDEVLIFEQTCDIRNNDAYIIKFEVECDFDKITGKNTMFMGTENDNHPFKLDTYLVLSGGVTTSVYHLYFPPTGFETAEIFTDDFRVDGLLYFHNDICTKGEYMEFVMKQWTDDEGFWHKTLEIDGVLKARYSRGDFTVYLSFSELINGRLGHHTTLSNDFPQFTRNGLGVKNYSIREY